MKEKKIITPQTDGQGRTITDVKTDTSLISEEIGSAVVLSFGRMNPPTIGHQKLVDKITSIARSKKAQPHLYLSHSQDKKKNPLSYNDKLKYTQKAFGDIVKRSNSKTIFDVLKEIQNTFDNVTIVVGSDRVTEFTRIVNKYNNKDFKFKSIKVVSAGERDPDADDVSGMSASKLRQLAVSGQFSEYKKGLPRKMSNQESKEMYNKIRSAMGISEELSLDETLTLQQRMKKKIIMRRIAGKIKRGRRIAKTRMARPEKLQTRSRRKARDILRAKLAGSRGANYKNLPISARIEVDKKVEKKKALIGRLAKRLLPKVRKAEVERLRKAKGGKGKVSRVTDGPKKESLDYDALMSMVNELHIKTISQNVEKNLRKKADKYNIAYEDIRDIYINYKKEWDPTNTHLDEEQYAFNNLNYELAISEDDKPNKRGDDSKGHKRPTEDGAGLTKKGVDAYRRKNPGSKLQTAVTTKPSKLKAGSKAAKRRKSFCARMSGMKGPMKDEKGRPTRKAMSLKRWNCN